MKNDDVIAIKQTDALQIFKAATDSLTATAQTDALVIIDIGDSLSGNNAQPDEITVTKQTDEIIVIQQATIEIGI